MFQQSSTTSRSPTPAADKPGGAFRLGSVSGIPIFAHWSWAAALVLVAWTVQSGFLPGVYPEWDGGRRWLAGFGVAVLFFMGVLVHELAHSLVARRRGYAVQHISLHVFGGVSQITEEPRRARDEFWIAIVGPLTSVGVGLLFFGAAVALAAWGPEGTAALAWYLAAANVSVGLFNMLPGFPLDGGRVLRSAVWAWRKDFLRASRFAANGGRVVGVGLALGGVVMTLTGAGNGLWLMFIGWFLWNAAGMSYQSVLVQTALAGVPVEALAERDVPRVAPDLSVRQLAEQVVPLTGRGVFFVAPTADAEVMGVVTLADVQRTPREAWSEQSVYRAMTPRDRMVTAPAGMDALEALQVMGRHGLDLLPVFRGRESLGVVSRRRLLEAIQTREKLAA